MAGIYSRDQINYGGMLGNAMANRANYLQRRYDRVAQMGQNWGNAVANSGKIVQDAFNTYANYANQRDNLAAQRQFQHDEALKRAEEQLARQREQEAWQAEQNRLQRESTERIAAANRLKGNEQDQAIIRAKNQMNYDIAQAEYNDAISKVDIEKPETVLAARKAAIKLNYNAEQLPYNNDELFKVSTEFTEDAPMVARNKQIISAKSTMDAIRKVKQSGWTDEQREQYVTAYNQLQELDPVAAKEYEIALVNKGRTTGDATRARNNYIQQLVSGSIKFDPNNKYGVKEEIYKDPTTGKWAKRYK